MDLRKKTWALLMALIQEVDETTFKALLTVVENKLFRDPNTTVFGQYFLQHYSGRVRQWAACYRVGANINTNMTIERWHKELKYNSDLKGKCGGRLDKAIHSLIKSLRMKMMNRLSSLQRGKLTKKLVLIRQNHKLGEMLKDLTTFLQEDENTWIVTSTTQLGETYKVRRSLLRNHKCNLVCDRCNICLHSFTCSCPNNSIKFNLCKHIHALCLKQGLVTTFRAASANRPKLRRKGRHCEYNWNLPN